MSIRSLFEAAKLKHRALFIPYLTAGDPTLPTTESLIIELSNIGVDVIELGVPFSDPVADGPINQLSAMRALKNNVSLQQVCHLVKKVRQQGCFIPIVLFTYFNPILRFGPEQFAVLARDCGVDAVLMVDLPIEEADEMTAILQQYQLGRICLISPTTTLERIRKSNHIATEFLYYVSRTGVTGVQSILADALGHDLIRVRAQTTLPIAVGFGVSTPKQATQVAQLADGVIVGSALVSMLDTNHIALGKKKFLALAAEFRAAI